jgi:hypothetical protein
MKHFIFRPTQLLLLLFILSVGFISCERCDTAKDDKDQKRNSSAVFRAKLARSFCAYNIVEILDSAFYSYGMNWTDPDGKTYRNAFTVDNYCEFDTYQLREEEIFNCQLVDDALPNDCYKCEGFLYTPPLIHKVLAFK